MDNSNAAVRECVRARLRRVDDVPNRFGEVVFGKRMFTDHSPKYYESCLHALYYGLELNGNFPAEEEVDFS